jgi:hypothetical protein
MKNLFILLIIFSIILYLSRCGSPLIRATEKGEIQTIKILIDKGEDVNGKSGYFSSFMDQATPLHVAAIKGYTEIIKILLDRGATIESLATDIMGNTHTPLMCSVLEVPDDITPHIETAKYLLSRGANIDHAIKCFKEYYQRKDQDNESSVIYLSAMERLHKLKSEMTGTKYEYKTAKSASGMLLAVMDFIDDGVSKKLASKISEMIRNSLINKGGYTVVERSQMNLILKEQGFQMSGCTDTSCAVKIGKLLSARKMLMGKVMKIGKSIIISGRIVDVEMGIGEAAFNAKASNVDELFNAVNEFVNNMK